MIGRSNTSRHRGQRFTPRLEAVEARTVPAAGFRPTPDDAVAIAPDDGGIPRVKITDPVTDEDVAEVPAFEDVNHDGLDYVIAHTRHGGRDDVRMFVDDDNVADGALSRVVDDNPNAGADDNISPPPANSVTPVPITEVEGRDRRHRRLGHHQRRYGADHCGHADRAERRHRHPRGLPGRRSGRGTDRGRRVRDRPRSAGGDERVRQLRPGVG
jgi:hypothetical protein